MRVVALAPPTLSTPQQQRNAPVPTLANVSILLGTSSPSASSSPSSERTASRKWLNSLSSVRRAPVPRYAATMAQSRSVEPSVAYSGLSLSQSLVRLWRDVSAYVEPAFLMIRPSSPLRSVCG